MEEPEECLFVIEKSRQFVERQPAFLREKYGNDVLAVRYNAVLGHNKDQRMLLDEINRRFEGYAVLVGTIDEILNQQACGLN